MSSSPRADGEPRRVSGRRGPGRCARGCWSRRSLLLAVVCAGIGIATEIALQRFLMQPTRRPAGRSRPSFGGLFEFGPPPGPPPGCPPDDRPRPDVPAAIDHPRRPGPGPGFLNAPGQATRTVGAVISRGTPVDAGVITADGDEPRSVTAAAQQLAAFAARRADDRRPRRAGQIPRDRRARARTRRDDRHRPADGRRRRHAAWVAVMFCVVAVDRADRRPPRRAS